MSTAPRHTLTIDTERYPVGLNIRGERGPLDDGEQWAREGFYVVPCEHYVPRFQRWLAYLIWLHIGFIVGLVVT